MIVKVVLLEWKDLISSLLVLLNNKNFKVEIILIKQENIKK